MLSVINLKFFCYILFVSVQCFNIDVQNPIIYEYDPKSYFGFTTALFPSINNNPPGIFIGAPRADYPNQRRFKDTGAVFKCGIAGRCEVIVPKGLEISDLHYNFTNSWLGSAMDISNDAVVTCAPRTYKVHYNSDGSDDYRMIGACFRLYPEETLIPLSEEWQHISKSPNPSYIYGQGQAGISIHLPKNENKLVLGTPGLFNWDGGSISYSGESPNSELVVKNIARFYLGSFTYLGYSTTSGYFYDMKKLMYVSGAPRCCLKTREVGEVFVYAFSRNFQLPELKERIPGTQIGEYFGSSLAAGDINGDGFDDLLIGAPNHASEKCNEGRLYSYLGNYRGAKLQVPDQGHQINGKGANGQFGTALQYLGDIDKDGYGDVAVSAPYEIDTGGVVYVFKGTSQGLDVNPSQRIVGKQIYANIRGFGVSISRTFDIDNNNYLDVAIGAYSSGHVAVLRGRPTLVIGHYLTSKPSILNFQVTTFTITACLWTNYTEEIKVTRVISIDPDHLRARFINRPSRVNLNREIVDVKSGETKCEDFVVGLIKGDINRFQPLLVTLSHKFVEDVPKNETVLISLSQVDGNIESRVKGNDMFSPRRVVYNKFLSTPKAKLQIPFSLGCKSAVCQAKLDFYPFFPNLTNNDYIVGSTKTVTLNVPIRNAGEKAYLTKLAVILPKDIRASLPSTCEEKNSSYVECDVANPLEENSTRTVNLELIIDVNKQKLNHRTDIIVEVLTNSENVNSNTKTLSLNFVQDADITISGKSGQEVYSFGHDGNESVVKFNQEFLVEKFGVSPIDQVLVEIDIPHTIKNRGSGSEGIQFLDLEPNMLCSLTHFPFLVVNEQASTDFEEEVKDIRRTRRASVNSTTHQAILQAKNSTLTKSEILKYSNRTFFVNCSMENVVCSKIVCVTGPFVESGQSASIQLRMIANISKIAGLFGKDQDILQLTTHGTVLLKDHQQFAQSGNRPDEVNLSTFFVESVVQKNRIELWIIVTASCFGFLLLLLLVLLLIRLGFFKRTTREDLKHLKEELQSEQAVENAVMVEECDPAPECAKEELDTSLETKLCSAEA